jgi:hypothetical protein
VTTYDRFIQKYVPEPNTGCWLWTGYVDRHGYGQFKGAKQGSAHRWSYEYHAGPIPEGLQLDHLCRVRSCVNPAHLEPVTCRVNVSRGLVQGNSWACGQTRTRGQQNGRAKLTDAEVLAIRADMRRQFDIATEYGIDQTTVSLIKANRLWKHI